MLKRASFQRCRVMLGQCFFYTTLKTFHICYAKLAFMLMALVTLLYQTFNNITDAEVFQSDINAVYEWSIKWKMSFNVKKMTPGN